MIPAPTGRFAPSPSGALHAGNLLTALLAWLTARAQHGRFLVRVDDLDPDRSQIRFVEQQLADLAALGIDWDEPPLHQSTRAARYAEIIATLRTNDLIYPCFCSRADVRSAARAPHELPDAYPGTCARLAAGTAARRVAEGDPHCLRVRANGARREFVDLLHGETSGTVDDFVVRRRDGVAAYNLAVVVDDADQGVTQVVRGCDLAAATIRQVWLYDVLELAVPRYAHTPLVVGRDGARLAKRHGSVTLAQWCANGGTPASLQSALLGLVGVDAAGASLRDVAEHFSLDRIMAHERLAWPP